MLTFFLSFFFFFVSKGSSARDVQVVIDPSHLPSHVSAGCSVDVQGILTKSMGKGQEKEIQAQHLELLGTCDEDYPLQKKEHSDEFLREMPHLRPRTSSFGAMMRIRDGAAREIRSHLHQLKFVEINAPIIVSSDCEGAGEMFRVSSTSAPHIEITSKSSAGEMSRVSSTSAPHIETTSSSSLFFGADSYLTVSAQLHGEAFAAALSRVFVFGPTFRAEKHSRTAHHLAEFWMMEPEMAFADMALLTEVAEQNVRHVAQSVAHNHAADLEVIGLNSAQRIEQMCQTSFVRMTYTEAIEALLNPKKNVSFSRAVEWGMDLQREHERYLCEQHTGGVPVFVTDYPAAIKPFYAKQSLHDPRCVQAVDLLVPGIGELIGGSVREDDYEVLRSNMVQRGMNMEPYQWYLDLRRFGTAKSAGYGMGFERFVQWITGTPNIRDVCPIPRWTGHIRL